MVCGFRGYSAPESPLYLHCWYNNADMLINKHVFEKGKTIQLAEKGKNMEATCVGDIRVKTEVGEKVYPLLSKMCCAFQV